MGSVDLRGRVAVVTGGSSGIGREIARQLAQAGARVMVASNVPHELEDTVRTISAEGGEAVALEVDLSDPADTARLLPEAEDRLGPLYLLVNNAGIGLHADLLATDDAALRRVLEVNFFAAAALCREGLRRMAPRRSGHLINVTSASARRALARMAAYASSKAALHSLTQTLRLEAAPLGVHVSEVLPISVRTPFFERAESRTREAYRPRGLVQTPEHVARVVVDCARHPRAEVCTSLPARLAHALDAALPNLVAWLLERRV